MGAHKYNPTAIAAKNGELPPKPPKKSKKELEREMYAMVKQAMIEKVPGTAEIMSVLGDMPYGP
jgi:hypothetical protein